MPATVELSILINDTWYLKDLETIVFEIMQSVKLHGFAVIIAHPQEFLNVESVDHEKFEIYKELINLLKETYTFKTLEKLYNLYDSH